MTLGRALGSLSVAVTSSQAAGSLLPACVLVFAVHTAAVLRILMVAGVGHGRHLVTFAEARGGALVRAVLGSQALPLSQSGFAASS